MFEFYSLLGIEAIQSLFVEEPHSAVHSCRQDKATVAHSAIYILRALFTSKSRLPRIQYRHSLLLKFYLLVKNSAVHEVPETKVSKVFRVSVGVHGRHKKQCCIQRTPRTHISKFYVVVTSFPAKIVIIFVKGRDRHRISSVSPSIRGVGVVLSIGISSNNLHSGQRLPYLSSQGAINLTLWTDDQTTALLRALVDGFDDVDQLLFVFQHPIQLVIVTRSEIAHHVFIAIEEHDRHRIVELVHRVEIGDLVDVAQVNDGEVCTTTSVSGWISTLWDEHSLFTRSAILYRSSS